jgi:cobalt-zinc-cadmium efflux system outer membrane protein
MLRFLISILLDLLLCSGVFALTLNEALEQALMNNVELKALRLDRETAHGELKKAELPFVSNPTIDADLATKAKRFRGDGGKATDYEVRLSQEVEIAGQRGKRIGEAEEGLTISNLLIKDKERAILSEVKGKFIKALAACRKVELAEKGVVLKKDIADLTRKKSRKSDFSETEADLAEIELDKAKMGLRSARKEYRESLILVRSSVGLKSDTAMSVEGSLELDDFLLPDMNTLKQRALRRPDVRAANEEITKSNFTLALTRREAVPNITLSGIYGQDVGRNYMGMGLSVPIPLFDRKQAEVIEAKDKVEQSKLKYGALRKTLDENIEETYDTARETVEEAQFYKREILVKSSEYLKHMNNAYKSHKIGLLDVRRAQIDMLEIESDYVDALSRARLAMIELETAVGSSLR